jgi:hypothetical protein
MEFNTVGMMWRLVCFKPPPAESGMRLNKRMRFDKQKKETVSNGKSVCWFRLFGKRDDVIPVTRLLTAAGVSWKCDKVPATVRLNPKV